MKRARATKVERVICARVHEYEPGLYNVWLKTDAPKNSTLFYTCLGLPHAPCEDEAEAVAQAIEILRRDNPHTDFKVVEGLRIKPYRGDDSQWWKN